MTQEYQITVTVTAQNGKHKQSISNAIHDALDTAPHTIENTEHVSSIVQIDRTGEDDQ